MFRIVKLPVDGDRHLCNSVVAVTIYQRCAKNYLLDD